MLEEVVAHTLQIITGVLMRNVSLLSAVFGAALPGLACGVGISTVTLALLSSQSELDFLKLVSGGLGAASLP